MITPADAARQTKVGQRAVYRWIEAGLVHFSETEQGDLLVCLVPLTVSRLKEITSSADG